MDSYIQKLGLIISCNLCKDVALDLWVNIHIRLSCPNRVKKISPHHGFCIISSVSIKEKWIFSFGCLSQVLS